MAISNSVRDVSGLDPGYTVHDLLRTMFYYKRALVTAFLVPVVLGLTAALMSSPRYVADARLLVLPGDEYVFHSVVGQQSQEITIDRLQIVQGELQILQDASLRLKVLQEIGPDVVFGHFDATRPNALTAGAAAMGADLNIQAVPQSNAINLTYSNRNPVVAAEVLNSLIAAFLVQRAAVFQRSPVSQLTDQRDAMGKRLQLADDRLSAFAGQHAITNLDDQLSLLLRQQGDIAAVRRDLDGKIDADEATVRQLQIELAAVPPTIGLFNESARSVQSDVRAAEFARLQALRREMSRRYREGSPQLGDIDHQLETLGDQISASPHSDLSGSRTGPNPLHDVLTAQVAHTVAELRGLQASRGASIAAAAAADARLAEMNVAAQPYRDLKRDRDVLEETYRTFSRNAEDAMLADQLQRNRFANVRVVQAAMPPTSGKSLRPVLAAGGVVLGLVAAVAALTVLTAIRQVIIDGSDAERVLHLPVLLTVPLRQRRPGVARDRLSLQVQA